MISNPDSDSGKSNAPLVVVCMLYFWILGVPMFRIFTGFQDVRFSQESVWWHNDCPKEKVNKVLILINGGPAVINAPFLFSENNVILT